MLQNQSIIPIDPLAIPSAAPAVAYTTPDADTSAIVKKVILFNSDTVARTAKLYAVQDGGAVGVSTQILEVQLGAKATFVFDCDILLGAPGADLYAHADANAVISINGTVAEFIDV